MRKTVGYFTLLAAVILIVCSAATLFWSAYGGATDPWQKWVQGTQIVCVIIWEAGALVAISYCARHAFPGRSVVVIGGSVLLLLAMGYTLNQELKQQAGAQESASTVRAAQGGKLELVRSELDKAIARRDKLQELRKPTEGQQEELATVRRDIAKLKDKWEAQIEAPHAALAPGVALIARWTGLNLNDSADLDPLIKMAFWTMARVFALPLAMFAISLMGASTLVSGASLSPKAMDIAPMPVAPALTRVARSESLIRDDLGRKQAEALGEPGTGSGGGGSPSFPQPLVEKVASPVAEVEAPLPSVPRIIINNDREGNDDFPQKYRGKKNRSPSAAGHAKKAETVKEWLSLSNQVPGGKMVADSDEVWASYQDWLGYTGSAGFTKRKPMIAELGRIYFHGGREGRRNPRNGKGAVFPGLVPLDIRQLKVRRTA